MVRSSSKTNSFLFSVLSFAVALLIAFASPAAAQHARIYAVVAGNDDPANSMAGSSLGSGLWQSDDTGRTWKQLGWKHIKAFSMDADSGGRVLYLAAGNGVLKSIDFGESWKVMTDWRVSEVMDVKVLPKMPSIVLAATAHGVIKSTDQGATWREIQKGLPQPYCSRLILSGPSIFVCNESGLYETHDLEQWTKVDSVAGAVRNLGEFNAYFLAVGDTSYSIVGYVGHLAGPFPHPYALWDAGHMRESDRDYVAGINGVGVLTKGDSRERPFNITYEGGPKNVHALESIGDKLFAGTLGEGIWVRQGASGEWTPLALPKSQVWTLKVIGVR